jgi:hypothetical protein
MNFNNCYFVQFSIVDGTVVPLWDRPFEYKNSTRIPTAEPFLTLPNPSKSGYKIKNGATHWGIFDLSNDQPECVIYQPFQLHNVFKQQVRDGHLTVNVKGQYFSARITKHKTIYDMLVAQSKG